MKQYAVLTNGDGDIIAVISYETHEELHNKTHETIFQNINESEDDVVMVPFDRFIDLDRTIEIKSTLSSSTALYEFYLTPTTLV